MYVCMFLYFFNVVVVDVLFKDLVIDQVVIVGKVFELLFLFVDVFYRFVSWRKGLIEIEELSFVFFGVSVLLYFCGFICFVELFSSTLTIAGLLLRELIFLLGCFDYVVQDIRICVN